jgi:hypothetical protein
MTHTWTDRLSDYIDDELDPEERRALEAHLAGCAACRETLAELNAVVGRGAALEDRPPSRNLWPGIAARIGGGADASVVDLGARRRVSLSLPQLAAAAAALLLVGAGGAVWLAGGSARTATVDRAPDGPAAVTVTPAASGRYDVAVAELEALLEQNRDRLDSVTVRVVEQNLAIIDRAIAEARAALAADPSDVYLNTHLANTMRRKVELLRRVAEIVAG